MTVKRCLMVLPGGYPPGDAKASRIQLLAAGLRCSGWEVKVLATGAKSECFNFRKDDYGTQFVQTGAQDGIAAGDVIAAGAERIFAKWEFDSLLMYGPFWKVLEKTHGWGIGRGCATFADCTEWYTWRPWRIFNASFLDHLKFRANLKRFSGAIAISSFWSSYLGSRQVPSVHLAAPVDSKLCATPRVSVAGGGPFRKIALAYFGALSKRNLALTLLDIVDRSRKQGLRVTLHCYGHHPMATDSAFMRRLVRLDLGEHVVLHGRLTRRPEVYKSMRSADGLILLRDNDRASRGSFPTRLPEMLASASPVIVSATADVQRDLVNLRDAYLIAPGNQPHFAVSALCRIAEFPEEAQKVGEMGRRSAARLYDYKVLGARLSGFMHDRMSA